MKTVIIPVDFSETSLNAVRYAANMFTGKPGTKVILYNMFANESDGSTAGPYLESLGRLAYQKAATLILMGISEKEEWRQLLLGSNSVKMAEQNICPVMIIPPTSKYTGIKNIALTSDFKDVDATTPVLAIKTVLEIFNSNLHIVNVDNQHYVSLTEEYLTERSKMLKMFAEFKPEFYFIGMNDFFEAITQFATDRNIDLIVIIPKNHSFVNSVFSARHTKKLAFQSPVPLLAAHQ